MDPHHGQVSRNGFEEALDAARQLCLVEGPAGLKWIVHVSSSRIPADRASTIVAKFRAIGFCALGDAGSVQAADRVEHSDVQSFLEGVLHCVHLDIPRFEDLLHERVVFFPIFYLDDYLMDHRPMVLIDTIQDVDLGTLDINLEKIDHLNSQLIDYRRQRTDSHAVCLRLLQAPEPSLTMLLMMNAGTCLRISPAPPCLAHRAISSATRLRSFGSTFSRLRTDEDKTVALGK